ncbi:MAG: hypothetical protein IPM64_17245 [Phycisphaerales bacterium]|nr:hypothetical protein [Phycisphaerales bacterium]
MAVVTIGDEQFVLRIDLRIGRRIRDLSGWNPFDLWRDEAAAGRLDDPLLLADVLWAIVSAEPRVANRGKDALIDCLTGDVLAAARDAVLDAAIDFFPQRQRDILKQLVATHREQIGRALAKVEVELLAHAASSDSASNGTAANLPGS